MFKLLFILFLTIPLLEIYILIQIGSLVGPGTTIALCVLTAALGAFLLRLQGLQTIATVQKKLNQGEVPAVELLAGVILLLSGFLLLTPGFFTDCIGFLCLVPKLRHAAASGFLLKHFASSQAQGSTVIVEGEFWHDDDRNRLEK